MIGHFQMATKSKLCHGKQETQTSGKVSLSGCWHPSTWTGRSFCILRHINKKLDRKQNSQDLNKHANVSWRHCKKMINVLCHKTTLLTVLDPVQHRANKLRSHTVTVEVVHKGDEDAVLAHAVTCLGQGCHRHSGSKQCLEVPFVFFSLFCSAYK